MIARLARWRAVLAMLEPVGGVHEARRAWDGHGRNAGRRQRVAPIGLGSVGGERTLAQGSLGRWRIDHHARLPHGLVREDERRHLQRLGQLHRPLRRRQAIGHGSGCDHDMRRVAMKSVKRDVEIALLGFGGDAGRRSAAHDIDDHDRHLGGDGKARRLRHQRQARAPRLRSAMACRHRRRRSPCLSMRARLRPARARRRARPAPATSIPASRWRA